MIQTELLRAAGVDVRDIDRLEEAWEAYQRAVAQPARQVPHIVCTGIYNAGKSTLLNALCGEEKFPTGDIPTTKEIAQAEFGGAVYVDTPGLNAEDEDDRETLATYDAADFILFVASAQNGGVSEAEAGWLKRLEERYTAGSLKRRLVYVLTHCGQVEPEQVTAIRDRTAADLEEIIGFAPEPIFSVDSVIYQKGISENKPLLVEDSVLPQLQAHLTELIAGAGETLRQAQADEIEARRRTLLEQINCCKDFCEKRKADISLQSQRDNVEALFTEAEKKIHKECSSSVALYGGLSISSGSKTFEGKDGSSLKRQAKDHVRTFAEHGVRDAHKAIDQMFRQARQDYGTTGINSKYFKLCDQANRLLEELQLKLTQHGASVQKMEEIHLSPDVSDVASDLAEIANSGDYWTASMYLDVNEHRIEVNKYDDWYEERGLFGLTKKMPKYVIYTYKAISEIDTEISDTFKRQVERAERSLSYYWDHFLEELRDEGGKRLQEMRKAALDSIDSTQSTAEKPLRYALKHLSKLKEEVSR